MMCAEAVRNNFCFLFSNKQKDGIVLLLRLTPILILPLIY